MYPTKSPSHRPLRVSYIAVKPPRRPRDFQLIDPHLREQPSFKRLRRLLPEPEIVLHGMLAGLYAFAYKFAQDGDLSPFDDADLADAVAYEGDPAAMMKALKKSNYLTDQGEIVDWYAFGGARFAERTYEAERKWDYRQRQKQVNVSQGQSMSTGHSGTVPECPEMSRNVPLDKSRQDTPPSLKGSPPQGVTVKYEAAFETWWTAYGKVGSKADAYMLWQHWRRQGAAEKDLLLAARNFRASDPRFPEFQKEGRTFLARKPNRWLEWVNPEPKPNGNGKREPQPITCPGCGELLTQRELVDEHVTFNDGHSWWHTACRQPKKHRDRSSEPQRLSSLLPTLEAQ